mgnify:CR=1 FL=1
MIIQSSHLTLGSQHQFRQIESEQEQLRYWNGDLSQPGNAVSSAVPSTSPKADRITLAVSREEFRLSQSSQISKSALVEEEELEEDLRDGWKLTLLRRLVERLTGTKIKLMKVKPATTEAAEALQIEQPAATAQSNTEQLQGWGLEYHYRHSYRENEQTDFSATGQVQTADGREIDINITLNMSRSFISQESIDILSGDALKAPLVVNFSGTAAQLEQTDLEFDLDLDGNPDQLQFVSSGSGFLALDKNSDGKINNGSELFGPTSGDGFAELAAYDEDSNNWIDENDTIFDQLRIWERTAQGDLQLFALAQRNVGAIYLDRIDTPFTLTDQQNQQLGQIQSTGLYLQENGLPASIQQLDLVV